MMLLGQGFSKAQRRAFVLFPLTGERRVADVLLQKSGKTLKRQPKGGGSVGQPLQGGLRERSLTEEDRGFPFHAMKKRKEENKNKREYEREGGAREEGKTRRGEKEGKSLSFGAVQLATAQPRGVEEFFLLRAGQTKVLYIKKEVWNVSKNNTERRGL